MRATIQLLFPLLALLTLSGGEIASVPEDEGPEFFVAQLGAASFRERQEAAKRLVEMGHRARAAVRDALKSDDLEVRIRAEKIWERLRWSFFPEKLDEETVALMDGIAAYAEAADPKGLQSPEASWKRLTELNGEKTLGLLLAMRDSYPGSDGIVQAGLKMLLNSQDAAALNSAIGKLPEDVSKVELKELLGLGAGGNLNQQNQAELMRLSLLLGNIDHALMFGSEAWASEKDLPLVREVADFVQSEFGGDVWDHVRELLDRDDGKSTAKKVGFCVALAATLKNKDKAEEFVKGIEIPSDDAKSLAFLHDQLNSLEIAHLLIPSMMKSRDPQVQYLAHMTLRDGGMEKEAAEAWDNVMTSLKTEGDCYQLGEKMGKLKDPRREKIWRKILAMEPTDSVYDANARFRLAPILEDKGKFGEAADMLEHAMNHLDGFLIMTKSDGSTISGDEAKQAVMDNIASLRKRAEEAEGD